MRVVFSPWRTTTSASAAVVSSDGDISRRAKAKRSTNGSSTSHSACVQRRIQACFITGRSSKRAYGGGGTSKRQRKSSKMSGGSSSSDVNSNGSSLLPLLALTSDHKISVISECLANSEASSSASRGDASPSLIEDSRWTYEPRPGPTTAFLPQQELGKAVRVNGGSKNKKNAGATSNGGKASKNNGNIAKTSSTTAIPSIPAVFDASSSRIFALQNGNTTISCWDTSDPTLAGPDDNNDNDNSSSCTAPLPAGRHAVSMHRLPTSATRSEGGSSRGSTSNCGVAGVLDDGTLYAVMFVSSEAALRVGYFEADCSNEGRGESISGRRSRGRKSTSIASLGGDNLRHLITIVSPGGDVSSTTAAKAGTKRKGSMSTMPESSAVSTSFTARVVFHDEDTGALRLVRHSVSVMVSSDEDALGGEVESHLYPPIHLSLPKDENDDGGCDDEHGEEEFMVIDPSSIQCVRLDSTALAVAFQVPSALDDESNGRLDGSAEGGTWYCIHLEGRNGEVTSAPFPLEVLPGCTVARIAGLAPNLVAVLSTPVEDDEGANDDASEDSDGVSFASTASLVVYDIRRSVAVQALDLPLEGDGSVAESSRFSSWNMLSDYRDGTIAVLASTHSGQSTYILASKLMTESSDSVTDVSMPRSLNQSTGIKRKYNLAAAIASAVSVSDDMGSSMNDALVPATGLGRDIRLIFPPSSIPNSSGKAVNNENGLEAIVGETMQAIDDVQVAFELDGLRTFLTDINISEEEDEMATSFETAYDLAVSSLLESSSQKRRLKPTDTPHSPRSIANGSSQQHYHSRSTADHSTAALNSQHLPQTFVDGVFDIALGITLQIHESNGDNGNEEDAVSSDTIGKIDSALRVLIKLIRTGKISARDHLAGGVMRSILLASQQIIDAADGVSPTSSSSTDESPSALTIIDSILCNSSDDIPEAILVSMLHHVLCYATVGDVVTFFSSPRQQRRQYLAPQKVQVLIDQMNETSAEALLLEKEKTTKKKGKAPTKKRKEEMEARLDELTTLTSDLEASVLSTGIHFFADRVVSYSTANSSLLRTAMIDTLVHAKRGEATAMLSILTKLLATPSSTPKLSGRQPTGFRTTSIVQWISALADAHLPALLDAEGTKEIATARKAVSAAIGQGEVIAGMKDLVDTAIRASLSAAVSSATHSKRKSTSKVITYDSAGRKRRTVIQKDPERTTRSRPASAYSIERLVI